MTQPGEGLPPNQPPAELDRIALNALTILALAPQTYFGRGLTLTEHDREQLAAVAAHADAILAPSYNNPDWAKFQALVQEGGDKGVLMSFTTHKGTNVPTWCVNGGDQATVRKTKLNDDRPAIEVPTHVFNLFHWDQTVKAVREYITLSDNMLRGRSTSYLGRHLEQLARLIPKPDSQ